MSPNPNPPAAPERSLQQRRDALVQANRIRSYRAALKKDLKAGRGNVRDVLREPVDERLDSMKVMDLLLAAPRIGRVKAGKILTRTRISPSKTLGGLSARQRAELIGELGALGRPQPRPMTAARARPFPNIDATTIREDRAA